MDYSTIKHIAIPEGTVSKIHRTGVLIWDQCILPDGYRQLSYIETDGNQYIDTGVMASAYPDGLSYEFRGQIYGYIQSAGNNYLFGCLNNSRRSGNISVLTGSTPTLSLYIGSVSHQIFTIDAPETGQDFSVTLTGCSSAPTEAEAQLDGVSFSRTSSAGSASEMPDANIYLFWCSGVGSTSKPFWGRLYAFTMTAADGTPIRHFVPCYREEDGLVGLYDTVEDRFYENAGSGIFAGGN